MTDTSYNYGPIINETNPQNNPQTYPNMNPNNSGNQTYPYVPGQPQPPPPSAQSATTLVYQVQNQSGSYCPLCNQQTGSYVKKSTGCITWIWCIVLFLLTAFCCWIPFVCDSCKENQVICAKCNLKKAVI